MWRSLACKPHVFMFGASPDPTINYLARFTKLLPRCDDFFANFSSYAVMMTLFMGNGRKRSELPCVNMNVIHTND